MSIAFIGWLLFSLEATVAWERSFSEDWSAGGFGSQWSAEGSRLIVSFTWFSWGRVQAPLGLQWLVNLLWRRELEVASFLGDDGTFMSWLQSWDELGLEAASLLWVQVTDFLWDVDKGGDGLVVAFLWSFFGHTASTADLDWKLLALGVADELAWLLLDVLGGTA